MPFGSLFCGVETPLVSGKWFLVALNTESLSSLFVGSFYEGDAEFMARDHFLEVFK